jgi:hypothetical protein
MASAAGHDDTQLASRLAAAVVADDVAGILALMRDGRGSAKTQAACCDALKHALERDAGIDTALVAKLLKAVLSGLRAHVADAGLTVQAARLLTRVLHKPWHAARALALGAADVMATVMRAQHDRTAAQVSGCKVLCSLAACDSFGFRCALRLQR